MRTFRLLIAITTLVMAALAQGPSKPPCDPGWKPVVTGGCEKIWDIHPEILSRVEGRYTKAARAAHIQGTVVLQLDVGVDGRAQSVQVIHSLDPGLDKQAIEAVNQWRFQPATKEGHPVIAQAVVRMNFSLVNKSDKNDIIEARNVPLAITTFHPTKTHTVSKRVRLVFSSLRLTPYVVQSFDHSKTTLGIKLSMFYSGGPFTNAPMIVVIDGKEFGKITENPNINYLEWNAYSNDAMETSVNNANLLRAIADGKEVFITVLMLGQPSPFDHVSFGLSADQLADCRLIVTKYDELRLEESK